jgi:hypothetical protein
MRLRESWEGLEGDIDELLGKKERSDDLKEEKLLEETERVREGTGRRH